MTIELFLVCCVCIGMCILILLNQHMIRNLEERVEELEDVMEEEIYPFITDNKYQEKQK